MNSKFKIFSTLVIVFISSFSFAQKVSPFQINGELFEIPGKWEFKTQLKESGQFHLSNKKEKLNLLISVRKPEKFEFYQEGLNDAELLNKFYKWEYDYWNSSNGISTEVSETKRNEDKKYIIWKLIVKKVPENNDKDLISYLLYAVRNNNLISINLTNNTDKKNSLTESESIELLEKVYLK
ncbi:hypothetical protein [Chryseobacterium turcicum]|uniref:DUF3805 domain-containing protein n=1 Tax=Chryseobacterium turcicum TaxID=2898076 RepID=A0A9Q3V2J4_9FLAO|nr:hypothetical protein [Chryseobacterium turcicum]MCD1116957.1 hypothetical protein [Chryseobacterium turcicum]